MDGQESRVRPSQASARRHPGQLLVSRLHRPRGCRARRGLWQRDALDQDGPPLPSRGRRRRKPRISRGGRALQPIAAVFERSVLRGGPRAGPGRTGRPLRHRGLPRPPRARPSARPAPHGDPARPQARGHHAAVRAESRHVLEAPAPSRRPLLLLRSRSQDRVHPGGAGGGAGAERLPHRAPASDRLRHASHRRHRSRGRAVSAALSSPHRGPTPPRSSSPRSTTTRGLPAAPHGAWSFSRAPSSRAATP